MEIQKRLESVELSMDILKDIKCMVYDKETVVQELARTQKKLFEKINVIVPNVMGI